MAVYVDQLVETSEYERKRWRFFSHCHMTADSLPELHAMADKIGLQRRWFQARPTVAQSHYDLTTNKRRMAVDLGAKEQTWADWYARYKSELGQA